MSLSLSKNSWMRCESANALLPTGAAAILLGIKIPASLASEGTILEWTNATDSSLYRISLTTSLQLRLTCSTSLGITANSLTAVLSAGWHLIQCSQLSLGVGNNALISFDNGGYTSVVDTARPETALTRLSVGRRWDGTEQLNGIELREFFLASNQIGGTEKLDSYNAWLAGTSLATPMNGDQLYMALRNDLTLTTGTATFTTPREPIWADDTGYVVGATWAQSTFDAIQAIRNADVLYDNMNLDCKLDSDSFGGPFNSRLAYWLVNELARFAGTSIKKLANGARVRAHTTDSPIVTADGVGGTAITGDVNDVNNYEWNLGDAAVQMAIPMDWGLDIHLPAGSTGTNIATISAKAPSNYSGPISSWIGASDTLGCKLLLRRGCDFSSNEGPQEITYAGDGLVPWATPEILLSEDVSGGRLLEVVAPGGDVASIVDADFQIIGSIWNNKSVAQGIGYLAIAGGSWSVAGHYADLTSDGGQPKQYTDEQINPVIAAFHDPGRKIIFVMSIATEGGMDTTVPLWIAKTKERCATLGITNYGFMIISQFVHTAMSTVRTSVIDFDAIAAADPLVCHVSIYKLTGGCFFHDEGTASLGANDANGAQQYFLEEYDDLYGTDYQTTPGRVMLDGSDLHLNDAPSAQFMAEILARSLFLSGELGSEPVRRTSSRIGIGMGIGF
jgi:hypothetical protein